MTVQLRGLPALAQAQGLPADYYAEGAGGGGAAAAVQLGGNANNAPGVFLTLRRALQLIGAALAPGAQPQAGSVLAEGAFGGDTAVSRPGVAPQPVVRLCPSVDIESDERAHGLVERCVAAESLDFMLAVLSRVRTRIEAHLPPAQGNVVLNFFQRAVLVVVQLRAITYHSTIPKLCPHLGAIPGHIALVKWCVCTPPPSRLS